MKANEQVSGLVVGLRSFLLSGLLLWVTGSWVYGQDVPATMPLAQGTNANLVTINVDNGPIAQVLNAFSRQTGRSIVIGPEVAGNITLRVTNIPWQEALDVILKPYGYGYYLVGDTIIICGLDKLPKTIVAGGTATGSVSSAAVIRQDEPQVVKVIVLKYLDASDVEAVITSQLTPQKGKIGKMMIRSQSWQDQLNNQSSQQRNTASESLGRLNRSLEEPDKVRGKTFVVVDTQAVLDKIQAILDKVDVAPVQIQIAAKFVEVGANFLRDLGVEWGSGLNGASSPGSFQNIGTKGAGSLYAAGGQQISGAAKPASFFSPSGLSKTSPFDGGMTLAFQKLTDLQFEVLLHLLQEDGSYNLLSSPSVLTMNNQDAVIIVGTKLPIIQSNSQGGGLGSSSSTSTTLDHYEDIGIKLKVMPQVCESDLINLIVHPSVRELAGFQAGKVDTGMGVTSALTDYPVITTREAETHVMVKSGQTIVIGGMLRDKKETTQIKVPFLGSIPLIGMLFRRETVNTEKIELLIFLTATIRNTTDEMAVVAPDAKSLIKVEKVNVPAKP